MDMLVVDPTYPPAQASAIYLQDFRAEPCQVCGENASGWHCGSITCEACKKFFLRSVNEEYMKYKCIREKKCLITRTTRTQCQYCRYAKCIDVGMKLSQGSPNPKIEEIFKQIPCAICQHSSSGIHFGATTCEGCKSFYRRTMRDPVPQRYKCSEQNNCEINWNSRNICRACRFQKCLTAGMSMEGSRIGRQSNLFKHKMLEMQRRGLIRSQLLRVLAKNPNQSSRTNSTHGRKKTSASAANQHRELAAQGDPTRVQCFEASVDSHVFQQILAIEHAYSHCLKDLPMCSNETNDPWMTCLSRLDEYTTRVANFAERIPNFCTLNGEDQRSLIDSSTPSIILLCLCSQSVRMRSSADEPSHWNYFNISTHSPFGQHVQQLFPSFFNLNQWTYSFEKELQQLQLDEREVALFISLLLTSIAHGKWNDTDKIERIQEEYFCALFDYMCAKRGSNSNDYFILTIQIPLIHRINSIISSNISNLRCSLSSYPVAPMG